MNLADPTTLCLIVLAGTAVFLLLRTRRQLGRQRQRWAAEEDRGPRLRCGPRYGFVVSGRPG